MPRLARRIAALILIPVGVLALGLWSRAAVSVVPSNMWAPTGSMSNIRAGAAGTLLQTGQVLITGGVSDSGATASTELYDATGGVFSPAAPMQVQRANHTATLLADGRVLVTGGADTSGGATSSAELFDPATNAWTPTVGSMSEARRGHTATLLSDGKVLIAGGDNAGAVSNTLEVFDPAAGIFSVVNGALSAPRTGHAAAAMANDRVLIAGGFDGSNPLQSTDIFDGTTGSVGPGPALSSPRAGLTATTLLDGRVLLAAGVGASGELATADLFDPATNTVGAPANTLTTARQAHLAFLLPHNNQVLIVGGTNGGTAVATTEYFTPWQSTVGAFCGTAICGSGYVGPAAGSARSWAAGSALSFPASKTNRSGPNDGRLVVMGGSGLQSADVFGFATIHTDKDDYSPGETVTITGSGWKPGESVSLILTESPLVDVHALSPVTADANGNISSTEFAPDTEDLGIHFLLTASGSESQAQTIFTDATNVNTTMTLGSIATPLTTNQTGIPYSGSVAGTVANPLPSSTTNTVELRYYSSTACNGSFTSANTTSTGAAGGYSSTFTAPSAAGTYGFRTHFSGWSTGSGASQVNWQPSDSTCQTITVSAPHLVFGVQPSTAQAGTTIAPAVTVQVLGANNALITSDNSTSVSLAIGTNPGGGTLTGGGAQTVTGGVATFSSLAINKTGTGYTLLASSGTATTSVPSSAFNITPGAAHHLAFQVQPSNAVAGATITPAVKVQVLDASNNVVTTDNSSTVSLAIGTNPNGGTLTGGGAQTVTGGVATFSALSINKTGSGYTLVASSSLVLVTPTATSTGFNITPAGAATLAFVQQPSDAVAGVSISPAVTVRAQDTFGNNVPGTSIAMALTTGTGTLSGTTPQTTNASGIATFSNLSINLAGSKNLTASSGALSVLSAAFNIAPAGLAAVAFVQQPTDTAAGAAIAPAITVSAKDSFGNVLSGTSITMTLSTGTGTLSGTTPRTTDSSGVATFDNLSIDATGTNKKLKATSGAFSDTSNQFSITAGTVATLSFSTQPTDAVAGVAINPGVVVKAQDSFGNMVSSVPIDLALTTGTGALSGTTTQPTNNGGNATFANLSINLIGAKKLTASFVPMSGPTISVQSNAFTITAAAAFADNSTIAGTSPVVADGVASSTVTITLKDEFGNPVSSVTPTFTATDTGSTNVYGACAATDASGVSTCTLKSTTPEVKTLSIATPVVKSGGVVTFTNPDSNPPTIICTPPSDTVWYGQDVTVPCTASDSESGLANAADASFSLTTSITAGNETASALTNTHQVCDKAGNCATAGSYTFKVDRKAPVLSSCDAPDGNWHGSNLTLQCHYTDGGSGPATASVNLTTAVSSGTETSNAIASAGSGKACDAVNNCAASPTDIPGNKVDLKAPTFSCAAPDGAWHANDVNLACTATDGGSGLANPADASFNLVTNVSNGTEDANAATNTRAVADAVGNSVTAGPVNGNKVDKKPPTISDLGHSPVSANTNGWYKVDVTNTFHATDGGSGLSVACANLFALPGSNETKATTGEGMGLTVTSDGCTDAVGNSAPGMTSATFNIDKTLPTASASAAPPPNSFGWNKTDVTVTFSGNDALSGIDFCLSAVVLSSEGSGQSGSGTCTDKAGNVSGLATAANINIDKTAPSINWIGGPADGGSYYFGFAPAAPTCASVDSLSGPNGCGVTGYANGVGSHTMSATAYDKAGNATTETRTFTVLAWTLSGFYQPVDMPPVVNTVKGGSTVPIKFEIFAGSTELTSTTFNGKPTAAFALTPVSCAALTTLTDDIELTTTGGTSFRYDSVAGQFIENWQTPKQPGYCYTLTMTAQDGSRLSANFKLK